MRKEIIRLFVPSNRIINDNSAQHYKAHMGKLKWLQNQTELAIDGFLNLPGNFKIPLCEDINTLINQNGNYSLILEHWKCNRKFDLANYEMMYKFIIDTFTAKGYWQDDNWKFAWPIIFSGGDFSVWEERALRFPDDGLPNQIKKDWWEEYGMDPKKDSFIRIIIDNDPFSILK